MRFRILHIGKFFPPHHGGMETVLYDLVLEQQAQGHQVMVLVHGNPLPDDPEWLVRVPVQIQLIYAPIALGFRLALAKVISQFRPDVLHLHMPNTSVFWGLTLASAKRIPWVVHWHSDVVVSRIRLALRLAYRVYRPFEQSVLSCAERIVTTSPPYLEASEPLSRWRDKCDVIPLGIGASTRVEPLGQAIPPLWQSAGQERLRLLSIGRLAYYKGFETLIRAVAAMPDMELLIVGDGELKTELSNLIKTLSKDHPSCNVRLLGAVSDKHKQALLQSCDVFCLASRERTEAFGVVLLEAMAHGKPCIVSELAGSGMPWVIKCARVGLTVETESPTAWQSAIYALRDKPTLRQQLGDAGRIAVTHQFSVQSSVIAWDKQYKLAFNSAAVEARRISAYSPHCSIEPIQLRRSRSDKGLLIVIPAKNEAATIAKLITQLLSAGWTSVVVIDDHSNDGTGDLACAAGAHVLRPVLPVGAWGGMQTGIRFGLLHGFSGVITMDADGQHEVEEIPKLLSISHQADLVIGAYPQRASAMRQLAWTWFRKLSGFELRDLTSGFRLYNREAMEIATSDEAILLDYQDLGALLLIRQHQLKIAEMDVQMNSRAVGKSKIFNSWLTVARYMLVTTILCVAQPRMKRTLTRIHR